MLILIKDEALNITGGYQAIVPKEPPPIVRDVDKDSPLEAFLETFLKKFFHISDAQADKFFKSLKFK